MKILLCVLILVVGNIVFFLFVKNWDSKGDDRRISNYYDKELNGRE